MRNEREKQRYWLTFSAERTTKPLIWEMSRKYNLVFNIRNSSVSSTIGLIALEMEGAKKTIEKAVRWLERKGVQVSPVELNTIEG